MKNAGLSSGRQRPLACAAIEYPAGSPISDQRPGFVSQLSATFAALSGNSSPKQR